MLLSKSRFYILIIFTLPFIYSCEKEEVPPKCDTCFINMYINGISWQADYVHASNVNPVFYSIEGYGSDSFNQIRESLAIRKIPIEIGTYKLTDDSLLENENLEANVFFNTSLSDGDVLGAVYEIIEKEDNFLKLERIDLENDFVEGQFQMSLIKVRDPDTNIEFPDTVRITQGVFRSDIRRE